jgi:hypothetical protein
MEAEKRAEVRLFSPLDPATVIGLVLGACGGRVPYGTEVHLDQARFAAYCKALGGVGPISEATVASSYGPILLLPQEDMTEVDLIRVYAAGN